jgi:hypothetical protein
MINNKKYFLKIVKVQASYNFESIEQGLSASAKSNQETVR